MITDNVYIIHVDVKETHGPHRSFEWSIIIYRFYCYEIYCISLKMSIEFRRWLRLDEWVMKKVWVFITYIWERIDNFFFLVLILINGVISEFWRIKSICFELLKERTTSPGFYLSMWLFIIILIENSLYPSTQSQYPFWK